jgi:sugar phosphate isomerase/epimerase
LRFESLEFSLGVVVPMLFPAIATGEGAITSAVEAVLLDDECDTVELTWIKDWAEERKTRTLLKLSGARVVYTAAFPVYTLGLDLASLDDARRRDSVEALLPWMDQAYRLGAETFMILSGRDPGADLRDVAKHGLADSVRRLCEHAETLSRSGHPLSVALEHSDRDVDKRFILGPTQEAATFVDEIRRSHPAFGLVMDSSHLRLLGEQPREALKAAQGRTILAHIANCIAGDPVHLLFGDKHPPFGVEGSSLGSAEVAEFLRALRDTGYFRDRPGGHPPHLSLEVKSRPGDRPEMVLAGAKRVLRQALSSLEDPAP